MYMCMTIVPAHMTGCQHNVGTCTHLVAAGKFSSSSVLLLVTMASFLKMTIFWSLYRYTLWIMAISICKRGKLNLEYFYHDSANFSPTTNPQPVINTMLHVTIKTCYNYPRVHEINVIAITQYSKSCNYSTYKTLFYSWPTKMAYDRRRRYLLS